MLPLCASSCEPTNWNEAPERNEFNNARISVLVSMMPVDPFRVWPTLGGAV